MTPEGSGWVVPGSRINHNAGNGIAASIEIQVYHFSAAVAGGDTPIVSGLADSPTVGGTEAESEEAGSCFISTLCGK